MFKKIHPDYVRSLMFGLEDALISTTGSAVGVSVGVQNKSIILLACFVYVAVEAISMAASQFLSERTVHEMAKEKHTDNLYVGTFIMFLAYIFGGILPMLPILIFPLPYAIYFSVAFAFIWLFIIGFIKGKFVCISPFRSALEMLVVGGASASVGVLVGYVLKLR